MEYLRSVMRGRIICTSMKMRKRMAGRLRDEGNQIKVLFKDLVSEISAAPPSVYRSQFSGLIMCDGLLFLCVSVRSLRPAGWTALCLTSQRSSSWRTSHPSRWRSEFWSESFQTSGTETALLLQIAVLMRVTWVHGVTVVTGMLIVSLKLSRTFSNE